MIIPIWKQLEADIHIVHVMDTRPVEVQPGSSGARIDSSGLTRCGLPVTENNAATPEVVNSRRDWEGENNEGWACCVGCILTTKPKRKPR